MSSDLMQIHETDSRNEMEIGETGRKYIVSIILPKLLKICTF